MTVVPRSSWSLVEGEAKPVVECPSCGLLNLGDAAPHGVRSDGTVYESVVCCHPPCTFHEYVRLEGWDRGEVPHR